MHPHDEHWHRRIDPQSPWLHPPGGHDGTEDQARKQNTSHHDPHAEYRRQAAEHFGTAGAGWQATRRQLGTVRFALQPWHALWAAAALCALAAGISSSTWGWVLIALLCAGGGWYARSHDATWPPDVHQALARRGLASPDTTTTGSACPPPPSHAGPSVSSTSDPVDGLLPPIPFRAMTISELFTGAARILLSNWPTLLGIPIGILLAFVVFLYVSMTAIAHFILDTSSSMNGGTLFDLTNASSLMSSLVILFVVFTVIIVAIALPVDALLLALSVIATNRAVRGQPVQFADVWAQARKRMFAVCRMTLTFYALSTVPDVVVIVLLSLGAGMASLGFGFAASVAVFGVSILVSLSPIVLAVEGRGVADSLRRSMSMSKPVWGRLIGIHLLWSLCSIPVALVWLVSGLNLLVYAVTVGALLAGFRVLQVLVYTDLRMRQEHYEHHLIAEWTANTGRSPI